MCDKYYINQLSANVSDICLQTCNVVGSEIMVCDTCALSLIVINTTINQLETKVLLTIICFA